MRQKRLYIAVITIVLLVGGLVYTAIESTAKAVTTVDDLAVNSSPRASLRVAGRVTDGEIVYRTSPDFFLSFQIRDIKEPRQAVRVEYGGIMPDTLQVGRDVILEGDFDGSVFKAKTLLTQCPSKYEVPLPGGGKYNGDNQSVDQGSKARVNYN